LEWCEPPGELGVEPPGPGMKGAWRGPDSTEGKTVLGSNWTLWGVEEMRRSGRFPKLVADSPRGWPSSRIGAGEAVRTDYVPHRLLASSIKVEASWATLATVLAYCSYSSYNWRFGEVDSTEA